MSSLQCLVFPTPGRYGHISHLYNPGFWGRCSDTGMNWGKYHGYNTIFKWSTLLCCTRLDCIKTSLGCTKTVLDRTIIVLDWLSWAWTHGKQIKRGALHKCRLRKDWEFVNIKQDIKPQTKRNIFFFPENFRLCESFLCANIKVKINKNKFSFAF